MINIVFRVLVALVQSTDGVTHSMAKLDGKARVNCPANQSNYSSLNLSSQLTWTPADPNPVPAAAAARHISAFASKSRGSSADRFKYLTVSLKASKDQISEIGFDP